MPGGGQRRRRARSLRLHQVHRRGAGRRGLARPPGLLAPAARRPDRARLCAQRAGRDRQRVHDHPPRSGALLPRERCGRGMARRRSLAHRSAGRRLGARRGALRPPRHAGSGRTTGAGRARQGHLGRPLQGGLALALGARDRDRLRQRDAAARQLRRRARLRAARAGRDAGFDLRCAVGSGQGPWHPGLRHLRRGEPSAREGLSGLAVGSDLRGDAADGGPRAVRRPREGRVSSAARRCCGSRRRARASAWCR